MRNRNRVRIQIYITRDIERWIRKEIEIDLQNQIIFSEDNEIAIFEIDPFRKKCILEGLDEIGLSLTHSSEIKDFERKRAEISPWIFKNKNNESQL